ncbi:nuclear receptor coactivator 7 isoform X2 [Chironomus tepperi]|uniref:nuclear receptor coactivator 7 isoform X2 n=1 Tax=Chironomus tepperi TaxID=113505 RepID=UPI00391F2A92
MATTVSNILQAPGRTRPRKDSTLMALDEEDGNHSPSRMLNVNSDDHITAPRKYSDSNLPSPTYSDMPAPEKKVKSSRRSSLGIGLLMGNNKNDTNKNGSGKRRSSFAAILGRRNSKSKEASSSPIEKREKYQKTSESDTENDPPMSPANITITITQDDSDEVLTTEKKRRRSSWVTKMERRRRKGLPSMSNEIDFTSNGISNGHYDAYIRQKRHSWWNIFVPENLKNRSRRSSQDAGIIGLSDDKAAVPPPYRRSKSRSVDHGLSAPFVDLDSLRSKVEGRFESIDRLSSKGSITPIPTLSYTVKDRDTLTSVAARFDTTPSELTQLNRLGSSFIYSGQTLLVPDKSKIKDDDNSSETSGDTDISKEKSRKGSNNTDDIPQEEKDLLDNLRPTSPKPGHAERVLTPNQSEDDPVVIQRFLKLNVRHITDGQGVVGGVLLVTPNAVMFDPNVSDTLVIEHGPESYGVIAPMEFIVNAAIFNDIAHMRVGSGDNTNNSSEKPEVYYPKPPPCNRCDTHSPGKDSLLVKDETFPELGAGSSVDQESNCSTERDDGDAFPKAFDRDLVTPIEKIHADSTESAGGGGRGSLTNDETKKDDKDDTKTEEDDEFDAIKHEANRRKSLLDQHWAIPKKDRSEDGDDEEAILKESSEERKESDNAELAADVNEENQLTRTSCHDSGIDIRDAIPTVPVVQTKKIYSDADIVLSSDWVPPLTIAPTSISTDTKSMSTSSYSNDTVSTNSDGRKKTSSVSFSVEDNENSGADKGTGEVKKNKMLKRLSYPLSWVEGLTGEQGSKDSDSAPTTSDSNQSVFSKVFSRRSSIGTFIRSHPSSDSSATSSQSNKPQKPQAPKLDYRSMVSIDDMPALFVSFDMKAPLFPQLENLELIPRPARACQDPPMYLRLRMGRPAGKPSPLPTTVMSYGKNKLRPEYWFSIPKNKVDELYRFIGAWVPQLYGELDEEAIKARGFELIQHDTEWTNNRTSSKDGLDIGEEIGEYTRESWEVLSMSKDDYRNASLFTAGSFEQDVPIPELIGATEILSEEHREKLCGHLPARAEGYSWSLVFSTSLHGFSLNSLYRKMHKLESPILIVIEDTDHNVFGALTSCSLHVSDHFYGTGESLLYKFNPTFKVFHWSGENLYFIKGNPESLAIGAGDGRFGLWLDGDLNQGRSQSCSTYSNEPLAPQEDFVIKTLECWAFV